MAIELNGTELTHVHKITTTEGGGHVKHKVPGLAGELSQDIGRNSFQLQIDGIFYGNGKDKELKTLREAFLKREPVEFLAQITGQAYASKVLIDSLQVMESGELAEQYTYQLILIEYIEPPTGNAVKTSVVDAAVSVEALQIIEVMELPDLLSLGSIPEISNPLEPLKGALTSMQEASSAFLEASSGLKLLFGQN